jgi:HPt (histidine-containing phosphotransfer) domain-containing protein
MTMSVIDQTALEKMIACDEELLADLAIMFVQLLPDLEARLRIGIENGVAPEVETVAHQLRSRVAYFGATGLQTLASRVELAAREGDLTDIGPACQQMLDGVNEMLAELRAITRLPLEVHNE